MLEGPEAPVKSLVAAIKSDPRHRGVIQVLEGFEDERQFPDCCIGFSPFKLHIRRRFE
jgi:hypothetical protein